MEIMLKEGLIIELNQEKLYNFIYENRKTSYLYCKKNGGMTMFNVENGQIFYYQTCYDTCDTKEYIDCFDFYIASKHTRIYHNDKFKIVIADYDRVIIESLDDDSDVAIEFTREEFEKLPFICVGEYKE